VKDAAPEAPPPDPWADALTVADLMALDPAAFGGVRLRGRPGPARDLWLDRLRAGLPAGAPWRKVPAHATEERLLGGLDLAATLSAGRPVARKGLLAEADGGIAVLAMAERASPTTAAHLVQALDEGRVRVERDGLGGSAAARLGVVALDEAAEPDEAPPPALTERLAFDIPLDMIRPHGGVPGGDLAAARRRFETTTVDETLVRALCGATLALGVASPRAAIFALRVARASAALAGREEANESDASLAARLVLGPRATQVPLEEMEPEEDTPPDEPPPDEPPENPEDDSAPPPEEDLAEKLAEMLIEAARATLPEGLLAKLRAAEARRGRAPATGTAGQMRKALMRGRPVGVRPGTPEGGRRLDLVETLRAAAPWQPLRRRERADAVVRVLVQREDFRIRRFKRPAETVTIFVVDASGSQAAQRLGEAKGAVELLLAEAYVRRDRVALIAFRGTGAQLLLPPTRSLARAKRELAGLPGGGGTPLALGLDAGRAEAEAARRHGWTPTLVVLTDGKANLRRDGQGGRAAAFAEAEQAARAVALEGVAAILIDTSARPNPDAAKLALAMDARYLPLPRADARAVSAAIRDAAP
jgi:magnesium chelatase subunit D